MVRKPKGRVHKAKGSKKNRKYGRNKIKCNRYRLEHRHEKSHIRRIRRHMAHYSDHSPAVVKALERYEGELLK